MANRGRRRSAVGCPLYEVSDCCEGGPTKFTWTATWPTGGSPEVPLFFLDDSMERARAQLLELGFDHTTVDRALRHAQVPGNDRFETSVETLVDWMLLEHSEGRKVRADPEPRYSRPCRPLGGLEGVFEREKEQLEEFADLVRDALHSVEALTVLANEMESCARRLVERKRLNAETEDDVLEDFLHGSNVADLSIGAAPRVAASVPRGMEGTAAADPRTRASRVGDVLGPHMRASHGVLSLSEAYRIYNRSRLWDNATPDEFVQACATFEAAGVPIGLERGALFSCGRDADKILNKVVVAVSEAALGASRVDISARMGLPVGVTALYLFRAESRALVARDDTARGVYYHANKFMTFEPISGTS